MQGTGTSILADVCVVCALAQEAQAFLRAAEQSYRLSWSQDVNHKYRYDYYLATMTNVKEEPVRLHVSWLSRYGSQEMVWHLSHVIEEYRPRLAIMTGICAGDKRHVHLGDLVVAERTFTYDSGKVVKDEQGESVFLHGTMTYQIHENIKRFVDLFEQWKPHVQALGRPPSKRQQRDWLLEQLLKEPTRSVKAIPLAKLEEYAPAWRQLIDELQQGLEPLLSSMLVLRDKERIEQLRYGQVPFPFQDPPQAHCHICPLASGNAVRSDDPFKAIQVPVREAVAIDMEGAAFGQVMQHFPGIEWLIVKGVSDYADQEKDDSYHNYAAMASATYALFFIEAYVTQERLPPLSLGNRTIPGAPPLFPGNGSDSGAIKPAFLGKHNDSSNTEDLSSASTGAESDRHDWSGEAHPSAKILTATPGTTILTYTSHADWVGTVAWSPNGEQIASAGGDGTVRLWDANSGHTRITYHGHSSKHQPHPFTWVWKALWSPDGQYIASSGSDTTVRVWKACSGKELFLYRGHVTPVPMAHIFALTWSPDGTRIASASNAKHPDQAVHVWNAHTGSTTLKYTGHALNNILNPFTVSDLAWSPNGQYIASAGSDKNVKKWNLDPTTTNKSIQVWRPTGERILTCGGDPTCNSVAWSPDSKWIAAGYNKVVTIWDVATGKDIYTYTGHTKEIRAIAWSPDGSIIASASNDHTVHLWHPLTGKLLLVYRRHIDKVGALAWSPDGQRIASAGADKTVQIWQALEK